MKLDRIELGFTLDGKAIKKAMLQGPADSPKVHLHMESGQTYVYTLAAVIALAHNLLEIGKVAESLGAKADNMSVSDLNEALLRGTLGIGQNGVAVAIDTSRVGWCAPQGRTEDIGEPSACRNCNGCGELTGEEAYEMRSGRKIDAIKLLRSRTSMGLKETKDAVEDWGACVGIQRPRRY